MMATVKFIKISTGQVYTGEQPYVHWMCGGTAQSTSLYASDTIAFISSASAASVNIDSPVFTLYSPNESGTTTTLDATTFYDITSQAASSITLSSDIYITGVGYIFSFCVLARCDVPGEICDTLVIDDVEYTIGCAFEESDEFLRLSLSNKGLEYPDKLAAALPDVDIYEDHAHAHTLNNKWRELLSNYMEIIGSKGSYLSLLKSLQWFGWRDAVELKEVWKYKTPDGYKYEEHPVNDWMNSYWKSRINALSKTTYYTLRHPSMIINGSTDKNTTNWQYETLYIDGVTDEDLKYLCIKWSKEEMRVKMALLGYFFETYFMPVHLDLLKSTVQDLYECDPLVYKHGSISTEVSTCTYGFDSSGSSAFDIILYGDGDLNTTGDSTEYSEVQYIISDSAVSTQTLSVLQTLIFGTDSSGSSSSSDESTSSTVTILLNIGTVGAVDWSNLTYTIDSSEESSSTDGDASDISTWESGSWIITVSADGSITMTLQETGTLYELTDSYLTSDGEVISVTGSSVYYIATDDGWTVADALGSNSDPTNLSSDGYYEYRLQEVSVFGYVPASLSYNIDDTSSGDVSYCSTDSDLFTYVDRTNFKSKVLLFSTYDENALSSSSDELSIPVPVGCVIQSRIASESLGDTFSSSTSESGDDELIAYFTQNYNAIGAIIECSVLLPEDVTSASCTTNLTGESQKITCTCSGVAQEYYVYEDRKIVTYYQLNFSLLGTCDGEYYCTFEFTGISGQVYSKYINIRILDNATPTIGVYKLQYKGYSSDGYCWKTGGPLRSMFHLTRPDPQMIDAVWSDNDGGTLSDSVIETLHRKMSYTLFLPTSGCAQVNPCMILYDLDLGEYASSTVADIREIIESAYPYCEVIIRVGETTSEDVLETSDGDIDESTITADYIVSITIIRYELNEYFSFSEGLTDDQAIIKAWAGSTRCFDTFVSWYHQPVEVTGGSSVSQSDLLYCIPFVEMSVADSTLIPLAYSEFLPLAEARERTWQLYSVTKHDEVIFHKFSTQTPLLTSKYRNALPLGYYHLTFTWKWGTTSRSITASNVFCLTSD